MRVVTCEHCGCVYLYRLGRRLQAIGHDDIDATRKRLSRTLKKSIDPISCPDCGYLQRAMVRTAKLERIGWVILLTLALSFVALVLSTLAAVDLLPVALPVAFVALAASAILAVSAAVILPEMNRPDRMARRVLTPTGSSIRRRDVPDDLVIELIPDHQD
jgi:hypothetical protein